MLITVAIFFVICAAVFLALTALAQQREQKAAFLFFVLAFGVIASVLGVFSTIYIVKAGSVGVVEVFGDVKPNHVESGIHIMNPFSKVYEMSTQTNNYWMSHVNHEGDKAGDDSVAVRSSNGLQMPIDVSVPYRLEPTAAPWIYKNLGVNWVSKILRPALSTAARRAASHYTAEELYSVKRDEFAEKTKTLLSEELNKLLKDNYKDQVLPENIVVITQVLIGHVGIPDTVKSAIEAKLKADQEQQAMEFTIMKAKKEKERKQIEAEGIQKFQEIVSKGIDDRYLTWKAIEASLALAESNNAKVIIFGGSKNGLPILLNEKEDKK